MKHKICPLCEQPVGEGSHWDCVFEMLADWVEHAKVRREFDAQRADWGKKVEEGKDPSVVEVPIEGVPERKDG